MRNIVWVIALVGLGLALITGGELAQGSDRVQYALWIVGIGLILLAAMLVGRRSPTPDLRPAPGSRVAAELDHAGLLYAALDRGQPTFESLARPRDLLQAEAFEEIVDILRWPDWQGEELIQYLGGANPLLACAAAEALLHREESAGLGDQVVEKFGAVAPWVDWFILRYLGERCTTPVVGRLLVAAHNLWPEYAPSRDYFNAFLQERRAVEGDPGFGYRLESCSEQQLQAIEAFLLSLRRDLAQPLLDEIAHWRHQRVDLEYLRSVGRLWPQVDEAPELVMHAALPAALETLEQALNQTPPRSVVVVGESGVGKSELIRE